MGKRRQVRHRSYLANDRVLKMVHAVTGLLCSASVEKKGVVGLLVSLPVSLSGYVVQVQLPFLEASVFGDGDRANR